VKPRKVRCRQEPRQHTDTRPFFWNNAPSRLGIGLAIKDEFGLEAAALSQACPTASSNRLRKGTLLGSCATRSALSRSLDIATSAVRPQSLSSTGIPANPALPVRRPRESGGRACHSWSRSASTPSSSGAPRVSGPCSLRRSLADRPGSRAIRAPSSSRRCLELPHPRDYRLAVCLFYLYRLQILNRLEPFTVGLAPAASQCALRNRRICNCPALLRSRAGL
jgi:hypothetical protein